METMDPWKKTVYKVSYKIERETIHTDLFGLKAGETYEMFVQNQRSKKHATETAEKHLAWPNAGSKIISVRRAYT